jgi:hypothetical protein
MPPRYVYWTIVAGGLPTAFRTAEREELLPTFKRIQEKHPDAEMKYFARGKLWASPEEARAAAEARRAPDRRPESRGRDWRPGGEHRDPRQKFKDAKKDRNLEWRKQRFERRQQSGTARRPEDTSRPAAPPAPADWRDRPARADKPHGSWQDRPPRADKPQGQGQNRPPRAGKPHGSWQDRPPRADKPQGQWQDRPPRAGKPPGQWQDRPPRAGKPPGRWQDRPPHADKPSGQWQDRPPRAGKPPGQFQDRHPRAGKPSGQWQDRPPRAGKPPGQSQDRPPRDKPHGDPLRRHTRPFARSRFERNQGTEEPKAPPPPKGPDREPKPDEVPKPEPPPRPSEPAIRPPGPPERGRRGGRPVKDRRRRS